MGIACGAAAAKMREQRRGWQLTAEALEGRAMLAAPTLSVTGRTVTETLRKSFHADVATFISTDPGANVTDFQATIQWGDGTSSAGTIKTLKQGHGKFAVVGTHKYINPVRQEHVEITVNDLTRGATASAATTIEVAHAPINFVPVPVQGVEGQSLTSVLIGEFTVHKPGLKASDFQSSASLANASVTVVRDPRATNRFDLLLTSSTPFIISTDYPNNGSATWLAEHPPADIITTVQAVTARWHIQFSATSPLFVADAPLEPSGGPIEIVANNPFHHIFFTVAQFTDGNPYATSNDFHVTINFGDGSQPQQFPGSGIGPLVQQFGTGSSAYWAVRAFYYFPVLGTFTVTTTITDVGGAPPLVVLATADVTNP